jgi:hypothetical protein
LQLLRIEISATVNRRILVFIDYFQEEDLKFSEFGEKIAKRLSDEK